MERKQYRDDVTDVEWELIQPILEKTASPRGRKSKHGKRKMINAIFYLTRAGCSWRLLPKDFPPWQTVYSQFNCWKKGKTFEKLHDFVRGKLPILLGRAQEASGAIFDSPRIKTAEKGGSVGMMQGRKSKGVKGILPLIRKGFCYRRM